MKTNVLARWHGVIGYLVFSIDFFGFKSYPGCNIGVTFNVKRTVTKKEIILHGQSY